MQVKLPPVTPITTPPGAVAYGGVTAQAEGMPPEKVNVLVFRMVKTTTLLAPPGALGDGRVKALMIVLAEPLKAIVLEPVIADKSKVGMVEPTLAAIL
ncbi:MAG: hypothetical protein RIT27_1776 [Pseudomonadota bacterium]